MGVQVNIETIFPGSGYRILGCMMNKDQWAVQS